MSNYTPKLGNLFLFAGRYPWKVWALRESCLMAAKEAKDALLVEISLRVSAVRHLPPGVNRNPLR